MVNVTLNFHLDKPPVFGPCKILDFELEMVSCMFQVIAILFIILYKCPLITVMASKVTSLIGLFNHYE